MEPNIDLLSASEQLLLLARIAHEMTVSARSTYDPGTSGVLEPDVLRTYNELQHRVTGSLRDHLIGKGGMPLESVLQMIRDCAIEFGRDELRTALGRAWERTLQDKHMGQL